MMLFVAGLVPLAFWGCKPKIKGFYADYASRDQSRAINGICISLILLSHTFAKVAPADMFDAAYETMRIFLGQFVVVPFLFYSGYGMMESLTKKDGYLESFPRKRYLKIVLQFVVITLLYIVMHLALDSGYSATYMLLSFTGITSIGNGGWFILSTFYFYAVIILWFNVFKNKKVWAAVFVTGSLILLMAVEMLIGFPTYYYNIVIYFGVGMFYSLLKEPFDKLVMKNNPTWGIIFLVSLCGFVFLKRFMDVSVLFYPLWCGFGMLMILCLTMKVKIQNKPLVWLGTTTFFNFTLQGIPQTLFSKFLTNNYLIYGLVIVSAILLAYVGDALSAKCERLLQKNKR